MSNNLKYNFVDIVVKYIKQTTNALFVHIIAGTAFLDANATVNTVNNRNKVDEPIFTNVIYFIINICMSCEIKNYRKIKSLTKCV